MSGWNPSPQYRKVAEANRQYYADTAQAYDATETCVVSHQAQLMLEVDVDRIIGVLGKPSQTIRALDACAGSGNISLKLLKRGTDVTSADISPDLLKIFQEKCAANGFSPKIVCAEIGDFLARSEDVYDLIVFSSALHHLETIEPILSQAFVRLRPGGLLFTVFDPTSWRDLSGLGRLILRGDYYFFKVSAQTSDLPAAIQRRLRRMRAKYRQGKDDKHGLDLSKENLGVLAEYHVEQGIDDIHLVEELKQIGFEVIWHQREPNARYVVSRALLRLSNQVSSFKLLLRKKAIPQPT